MADDKPQPLAGVRVIDLSDGRADLCGRMLADLGADVVLVEPPEGSPARRLPPVVDDVSTYFAYWNSNKRGVRLDLDDTADRERLHDLLASADVCIDTAKPGSRAAVGLDPESIGARHPHLVVTSITNYGQTGPYSGYEATDSTINATAGMVAKAGLPDKPPLLPPGHIGYAVAGGHGAFATLAALYQRTRNGGAGQVIDLSINEAVAQVSDWSMPNASVMMRAGLEYMNEVRNGSGPVYAIFACKTGYVRLVILSPRQWRAMRAWLGEPDYLQDPELEGFPARLGIADAVLNPLYEQLFSTMTMEEVSAEAQARGIVCTPVLSPADVLTNEHFASRNTFLDTEIAPGVRGPHHAGFFEIDGERCGFRHRAPEIGEHDDEVFGEAREPRPAPTGPVEPAAPLAGLRVMDFGHGGVGVEAGRMLAEYGADVIKIESITYPDFMRMVAGTLMSPSFASSSRSKRSLGVNAKGDGAVDLLKELAKISDVVIENNSTGTMDSMGLGYDVLSGVNESVVMTSSQLLGSRGAWADWIGYGPSTQPFGGIVHLWNYDDQDFPAGSGSIFPDHYVGRLCAIAALAELIGREAAGHGAHVEVAQGEVAAGVIGDLLMAEGMAPGSVVATGNRRDEGAPWGVYPCAGTQQWIAITVRDDAEWAALVEVMGSPEWATAADLADEAGRRRAHGTIDAELSAWTVGHDKHELMATLQAAGVVAGVMSTGSEQVTDPHLLARGYPVDVVQQDVGPMVFEGPAFRGSLMVDPYIAQAPRLGEHTREICLELLGMDADEVDRLFAASVLEDHSPAPE